MKYLILLLVCISKYATAQIFPTCPAGTTLSCTQKFNYDAAGNRKERRSTCACIIILAPPSDAPTARLAATDSTGTAEQQTLATTTGSVGITNIYPNPTNSNVRVEFSLATEKATIQVSNSLGAVLGTYTVSGSTADIPLGDYPAGIYLLTLLNANGISTHRVIKAD